MPADVSVLMCVYGGDVPEYFSEAIESMLTQTLPPSQVVVVVDGPVDANLQSRINFYNLRYDSVEVVNLKENCGLARALNTGMRVCRGQYIVRMDSDDISEVNRVAEQVRFMEQNPRVAASGCWVNEFIAVKDEIVTCRKVPSTDSDIKKFAKFRCPLNHPTVIIRRSVLMEMGGYTNEFPEDYFLWWKMIKSGYQLANIPVSLLNMRLGPDFLKRRGLKFLQGEIKIAFDMWRLRYLSLLEFLFVVIIRTVYRSAPHLCKRLIYRMMRTKQNV